MPGGFQKGNKIGNRFRKGVMANPLGSQGSKGGGIPRTIRAKWLSVESGLSKAGIVLDIVNQEIDTPEGQANIRQSIRDLMTPGDPAKTMRFLSFVMTFAPKVKQEALLAEFSGNQDALRRAVAKLDTTTGSDSRRIGPSDNSRAVQNNAQVVDIGL